MPFEVQEDSSRETRDAAVEIFNSTRSAPCDTRRFDWLYSGNPDGPAVVWCIRDTASNTVAGFTVALPRRMIVDGQQKTCWNCADFSILPKYRTLGVALKLRRAAKQGVDEGRVDFLYAHPNERMAPIHAKVGHQRLGRMLRSACVLRSAAFFEKKVGSRAIAAAMGGMVDPLLRAAQHTSRAGADYQTQLESPVQFDERFDDLHERSTRCAPIFGVRDSRYLTWRYGENPLQATQAIVAAEGSTLLGYLLFTVEDDVGFIKDVFPPDETTVVQSLCAAFLSEARSRQLSSLSVTLLEGSRLSAVLADYGFKERPDSSEMMVYASEASEWSSLVAQAGNWHVTVGDRDV